MKRTVKTLLKSLLMTAALAALSAPAWAHPPQGGHRGAGPAWAPVHAPRHGAHYRHDARHRHKARHGRHYAPPRHHGHRHGPRCGHAYRGTHYYRPRHPTYGAYGASLTLRLDDVHLSIHGRR